MSTNSTLAPSTPTRCPVTRLKNWLGQMFGGHSMTSSTITDAAPAGKCPLGFDAPSTSVFIDKASREASEAPVVAGDPAANQMLSEARGAIYHWAEDFPGFHCQLRLLEGGEVWRGDLRAAGSRDYDLRLDAFPKQPWLRFQIEEFLAHREHPAVSRMASPTGVAFGDEDGVFGRRVDFLGDKMGSWYRIRDQKLTMIGRSYSNQTFVITIDDHLECAPGKFASTQYTAYYRDIATGRLKRVEAFLDRYVKVGAEFLPAERRYTETSDHGMVSRSIQFFNHQLL